ncbi:hypothetical protein RhiirA4_479298 [Rhizophagus irregularis]|uniref:Uncharacterized protein n=1 Tax=Rhizophagus irregularis TaxID=588596 RepID=A0A2I1HG87_9GLOM|nr:hypothetical protein RhiirA4_479298 [Rhizophagus irregularis]
MYGMTMEDINVLDKMADRIRKRWIKLQQKLKLLNRVDQFKKSCIENEIQAYQLSFERIITTNSENESPIESDDEENSDGNLSDDGSEKERQCYQYHTHVVMKYIKYAIIKLTLIRNISQNYDEQTAEKH